MTPQPVGIGSLCRIYSILLYAYPREFRLAYGGLMMQLFRDRCRDMLRKRDRAALLRFALHLTADWFTTTVRERGAATWSAMRRPAPRNFVTEWALTIAIFLFATTSMLQAFVVPTGSMEGNLMVGDHMLVDRIAYSDPGAVGRRILPYSEPSHGDIVAFFYPEDVRQTFVKRVIGVPGDRIRLENRNVIRNGVRLVEPYTQHIATYSDRYRDNFPRAAVDPQTTPRGRDMLANHVFDGEVTVPPGTLFVLGDNRDNSLDSRYWGFVPRSYVLGKPLVVYWSYDAPTEELAEWRFSHVIDVALHFFSKTRWERTLLVPHSQTAREEEGTR